MMYFWIICIKSDCSCIVDSGMDFWREQCIPVEKQKEITIHGK